MLGRWRKQHCEEWMERLRRDFDTEEIVRHALLRVELVQLQRFFSGWCNAVIRASLCSSYANPEPFRTMPNTSNAALNRAML